MDSYRNILFDDQQSNRILSIIADTLLIVNYDGTCLDFKPGKSNAFFGQEVIGQNILNYFPENVQEELKEQFSAVLENDIRSSRKFKLIVDNRHLYCKCIINKLDDTTLIFQFRDVTENSIRKQNMLEKIEKLHEIERLGKLGYWTFDTGTNLFTYQGYTGVLCKENNKEQISLDLYMLYVYPNDREKFKDWLDFQITHEKPNHSLEYRFIKDDKIIYLRTKVYARKIHKDKIVIEGYIQNVTDIIKRDNQLDLITHAMNHATEDIFAIHPDKTFYYGNYSFKRHYGVDENTDLYGKSLKSTKTTYKEGDNELWNLLKEPKFIIEHPYPDYPNILAYEYATYVMIDSQGEETIWVFGRDISDRLTREREQEAAKKKAEESNQLKSAFLANMSHEIRTPLNAVMGFSQVIADTDDKEQRKKYFSIVEKNNFRLRELIDEILDLSKIESGMMRFNYTSVKLSTLCEDIKHTMMFRCKDGVELIIDEEDTSLVTLTDRNRLFQVFSNLIGNATKFTSEGSIRYGYKKVEDQIVFHVTDTGIGIAKDKLKDIFDRYIMASNTMQGTGLGLSISKIIVEKLGGNIHVESELGKGTTFTFNVPYKDASALDYATNDIETTITQSSVSGSIKQYTILVAEDNDSSYELIEAIIGNECKLIRAYDGMETVQMIERCKPDMILMDIKMPNIDGLDATRIIREMMPNLPIIAVSAYAYPKEKEMALASGCNDFLTKPIEYDKLRETINKYLN